MTHVTPTLRNHALTTKPPQNIELVHSIGNRPAISFAGLTNGVNIVTAAIKPEDRNPSPQRLTRTQKTLLPLVAVGSGLAMSPAAALELGAFDVQSRLGQPLRASIAFALAPNEQVSDHCITLRPPSGWPGIGDATIRVANGAILVSGSTPIREPLLSTRVIINCPYAPKLSREYSLFIDPAGVATDAPAVTSGTKAPTMAPATTAAAVAANRPAARPAPKTAAATAAAVAGGTRYRVQPGDSLSTIAARIPNRPMGLWPTVNAIFEANPEAFMHNDPNQLKAGAWLAIPDFAGAAPVAPDAAAPAAAPGLAAAPAGTNDVVSVYVTPAANATPAANTAGGDVTSATIVEAQPVETPEVLSGPTTDDLQPGDVILINDTPLVESDATLSIPDTELPGPTTTSVSPNVPTAIVSTRPRSESSPLLIWLAGTGIGIILALVLFGRRLRERFGSTPVGAVASETPARRVTDMADDDSMIVAVEPGYDLEDDSPTEENLALDADLILGTGLEQGTDVDIAQDFGFAATTELDIELPFEPQAPVTDSETDIIPPLRTDEVSILESEVLPEDNDYDMSVIMDATKMPQPEDVTERDLKAVPVDTGDETLETDSYTISKEVDYDILEQDYEDELTATQALNLEIERAASELADRLEADSVDEETSALPLATVTELDVTAQLPARDTTPVADSDQTAANESITVNIAADDKTTEMAQAGNDDTVEMEAEGGKVDTKTG